MQLQLCDKCRRPLSEGCIARGEAVQRGAEVICAQCLAREPAQVSGSAPSGLAGYEKAAWSCEGCGMPVGALDLIEGRASRLGGRLLCFRCGSSTIAASTAVPQSAPAAAPAAPPVPRRFAPRTARPTAERFVEEVKREQRRPVMPILLFAVVLPMFAVSVYFAISYQQKLGEALAARNAEGNAENRRAERPFDMLQPEQAETQDPESQTPTPAQENLPVMSAEVARELAEFEQQLANPVILQLQSKELPDVWEGLIAAGARRYIATRPYVRALLREPDDGTRALACRVCALLSDADALPDLSRMAESDPNVDVRAEARKAKGRLTGQATREIEDMSEEELENYARELQREMERRKGTHD